MANYNGSTSDEKGSPNIEALQYVQENWGQTEINASVRVARTTVTASGTAGIAVDIPQGATILDVVVLSTDTIGSGTVQVKVTDGSAISDAITMETANAITRLGTIDPDYAKVGADGIELVTNGDSDEGYVDIYYKK